MFEKTKVSLVDDTRKEVVRDKTLVEMLEYGYETKDLTDYIQIELTPKVKAAIELFKIKKFTLQEEHNVALEKLEQEYKSKIKELAQECWNHTKNSD